MSLVLQMIKKQYPGELYSFKSFGVKFSSDKDTDDPGIGIKVLDTEDLKGNGWDYFIENCSESSKV